MNTLLANIYYSPSKKQSNYRNYILIGLLVIITAGALLTTLLLIKSGHDYSLHNAITKAQENKIANPDAHYPKLVLWITIDQLRADFVSRMKDRFGSRGFRYLMENGIWYTNANFRHATTITAVGHASLFTGGNAAQHGLPGNHWLHPKTRNFISAAEDNRHKIIGKKNRPHEGVSPRNLTSTTVGDELIKASGGKSRVFSVSIKDRGAIIPGGHRGKAFWYYITSGEFITSTYYYKKYPHWVKAWNEEKKADRYKNQYWKLFHNRHTYIYKDMDDRPQEKGYKKLGTTFPHPLYNENPEDFYSSLRYTPMGDELTLDFAFELMKQENPGFDDATDIMAISFSALDYVGHAFGPNSLEYEDHILRVDAILAELFDFIDAKIGLEKTLIILASDHGVNAIPEYSKSLNLFAGRHDPDKFIKHINLALQKKYGVQEDLITAFWVPSIYLNTDIIQKLNLDISEVEKIVAEEIVKVPGIACAFTRSDLMAGNIPDDPIAQKVKAAFHPKRSGNVLIVQNRYWYLDHYPDEYAAMHGSPYKCDTHVPIMISGPGIRHKIVNRPVCPEDIASTVCSYLEIPAPSGSTGTPLKEVRAYAAKSSQEK
jgi:arylsulfatase A-like enzyme